MDTTNALHSLRVMWVWLFVGRFPGDCAHVCTGCGLTTAGGDGHRGIVATGTAAGLHRYVSLCGCRWQKHEHLGDHLWNLSGQTGAWIYQHNWGELVRMWTCRSPHVQIMGGGGGELGKTFPLWLSEVVPLTFCC